jgi:hypothetical protein
MAQDSTQLIVKLEAKLDGLEKGLKKAGVIADDAVKKIETGFFKSHVSAAALGNAIGNALSKGFEEGLKLLERFQERFKGLQKTAEIVGLGIKDLFSIQEALGGFEEANKAVVSLATLLDRARRGEDNYLSKLLKVNGEDIKSIKDAEQALFKVADIISRLPNKIQQAEVGKALGLPDDVIAKLAKGADHLRKAKENAAAAAPDLDKLGELAQRFENAWKAAVDGIKGYFAANFEAIQKTIVNFITATVEELRKLESLGGGIRGLLGIEGKVGLPGQAADALQTVADAFNKPLEFGVNKDRGKVSKPVSIASGGGGSSKKDKVDAFEREERRARE